VEGGTGAGQTEGTSREQRLKSREGCKTMRQYAHTSSRHHLGRQQGLMRRGNSRGGGGATEPAFEDFHLKKKKELEG